MATSIKITNSNGLEFLFQESEVDDASYSISAKIFKEYLPDESEDTAIVINLGRSLDISFPFRFLLSTTDAANGTHTSEVKTVQEKINYWLNNMITDGIEDLYTIEITTTAGNLPTKTGMLESFRLEPTYAKPSLMPGSISISVGGSNQT